MGVPTAGGVGKNCIFRPVEKSPAQVPCRRKFASICHGGLHPQWCAGGIICGVINNIGGKLVDHSCGSVHNLHQQGWLYQSLLMTLHARSAVVVYRATVHAQQYKTM